MRKLNLAKISHSFQGQKMFEIYDRRRAEYPSEHNVGHEYVAKKDILNF